MPALSRINAIVVQSGAPFTVNLAIDRANIGEGPAQRPDQLKDRTCRSGPCHIDFALAKTWRLPRTSTLELRWEMFNLLNRAHFGLPNRIFGSSDFGRISSANNPREMQFGTRLAF